MALSDKDLYIIERYFNGLLTSDEKSQFEARRTDQAFEQELQFQLDLRKASKQFDRKQIKTLLKNHEKNTGKTNLVRIRQFLLAAASILLILVIVILLDKDPSEKTLFAQYYKLYPNVVSPITKSEDTEDAYKAYELQKYEDAILLFGQSDLNDTTAFYLGLSYLGIDNLTESKRTLELITDGHFHIPALWYRALIQLKVGEKEATKLLLSEIVQSDHPLTVQAQDLLEDLQ